MDKVPCLSNEPINYDSSVISGHYTLIAKNVKEKIWSKLNFFQKSSHRIIE
jgi:hypothetical protein